MQLFLPAHITAIIGHTGSGKSTLLMHLNGLLKPSEGVVQIGDTNNYCRYKEQKD